MNEKKSIEVDEIGNRPTCIITCEKGIYCPTCNDLGEGKVYLRTGGVEI